MQRCGGVWDREQGNGVPQKGVADGGTHGALGIPQAGCVLESVTFKGLASMDTLRGTHGGIPIPCLGVTGMGSGSGLVLVLGSGEETCCMGLGTSRIFMVVPSQQGSKHSIPMGCSLAY